MRRLFLPALSIVLATGCSTAIPPTSSSSSAVPPTASTATTAPNTTLPPPPTSTGPTIARAPDEIVTTSPVAVATAFIRAALDADRVALARVADPSFVRSSMDAWIPPASKASSETILATKLLGNAAGHASVAVFVDAGDVTIAALPYVVELTQDPTTGRWTVIDAGLSTP